MNKRPAPIPMWTVMKIVKRVVVVILGEAVLVAGITLMALVVLVLLVFPGGVEVLANEWERAKRWIRCTRSFLIGKSAPLLAIHRGRRKLWGGALFT